MVLGHRKSLNRFRCDRKDLIRFWVTRKDSQPREKNLFWLLKLTSICLPLSLFILMQLCKVEDCY